MEKQTQTVKCTKDVDYVSAGETYAVEHAGKYVHFRNVRTGGATSIFNYQFARAVKSGAFVVEAP